MACQNLSVTDSPSIRVVRVYELGVEGRGGRWLVDRRWPRGVKRDSLQLAGWAREAAPSDELRRWFGHDPSRWEEFRRIVTMTLVQTAYARIGVSAKKSGRRRAPSKQNVAGSNPVGCSCRSDYQELVEGPGEVDQHWDGRRRRRRRSRAR